MNILSQFTSYINKNNTQQMTNPMMSSNQISFNGHSPEKLLKKILEAKTDKSLKITFDELVKIYNHLGYDVVMKRGSHAIVTIDKINIPIVIPHKDKVVHPNDLKRLKLILKGEVERAQRV